MLCAQCETSTYIFFLIFKIKTSSPTFVPSILTGITSSVTTFRSPPKNLAAMFDFSVAGPLAGMAASLLAIAAGAQLTTVIADTSFLPALPLEILRQSTLGGGIIEYVLGNGALYVPEGALGTETVAAMTIPLHPIAIAGYISLLVNALAILPIGSKCACADWRACYGWSAGRWFVALVFNTFGSLLCVCFALFPATDGGRAAIALFGRAGKLSAGTFAIFVLFVFGAMGSDLFLFYALFCLVYQTGNEIPARNEVDKLDLPRSFTAVALYVLAALSIVPFQ